MSGFEVVGVLLGAIPLVVSALQSYKETKKRYIWFASKEVYVDRLVQSLNEQVFFIKADVGLALRATHLKQETIARFLDDPDLNLLSDVDVADALQDYLGDGFQVYTDCLTGCQHIVSDIAKNLSGLVAGTRVGSDDLPAIIKANPKKNGRFEFTKKIKFSLQKDDLDVQIRDLNKATKILSRINAQSTRGETVAVQSTSRTLTKFASTLATIRGSAHRLYSAISLGYTDACHEHHEAKLFLQTRSGLIQNSKAKTLKKPPVAFEVAFAPACINLDKNGWSYKTEVRVIEGDEGLDDFGINSKDAGPQPTVTFDLPDPPSIDSPALTDIEDLCSLLLSAYNRGISSQLFLSGRGNLCSIEHSNNNPATTKQGTTPLLPLGSITLKQLFNEGSPHIPRIPLNQRIALSFNIASSVMQLHSTPWLTLPLTSSSVCFIAGDNADKGKPLTQANTLQPFIRAVFANRHKGCNKCHSKSRDAMLELGILLLELWHARTIEAFAIDSGLKLHETFGTRYEVAQEWISQSEGDMMPFYLEAATRCIECTFTTSSSRPEWSDITFQKSICQYVLKPLLDNCPSRYM